MYRIIGVFIQMFIVFFFVMVEMAFSANINLSSCEQSQITSAINAANDGDVIIVPAGTCTWSSSLNIANGVVLKGAGIDKTVINSGSFITVSLNNDSKIEGFKFKNGLAKGSNGKQNWVVKDCSFTAASAKSVTISGLNEPTMTTGVFHHCEFTRLRFVIDGKHLGEEEWGYADDLGGTKYVVYIEGCTFWEPGSGTGAVGDGNRGGQAVWRFNTFHEGHVQTHGARENVARGMRKIEWYRNRFERDESQASPYSFWIRGGTALMFDNDCTGTASRCKYLLDSERVYGSNGQCSVGNSFDTTPHPATGSGVLCRDVPGAGQDYNPPSPNVPSTQHKNSYSPAYFWNNNYEGGIGEFLPVNGAQNYIVEGRDYFLDSSSVNGYGKGGVESGLWANRPTCNSSNKYYGYWATDKGGDWNSTDEWHGDDGALYVCNGAGTWNLYYIPAPYPHPLVQSGGNINNNTPLAPSNLRVVETNN